LRQKNGECIDEEGEILFHSALWDGEEAGGQ